MTGRARWRVIGAAVLAAALLALAASARQQSPDLAAGERQILMEFFAATNGPGWTNHDRWGTTASPCEWYGVMCGFEGRVSVIESLFLTDNNLRGTIPATLGNLQRLQTLFVSGNHLTGDIPERLLRLWDAHEFEFDGWGNRFSFLIVRATVASSASSVLCDVHDDVRYQIDIDALTGRATLQSVRCASANIKSRKTYCLVREGRAPRLERVSRALQNLKFPSAGPRFDYPFSAATHGEYLTTTVEWGDGSKHTVETYNRQGPLDVWMAQQMLLGAVHEISWFKESKTATCSFEK